MPLRSPSTPASGRIAAALALGLVVAVYAPSLEGGWVWDDRYILADNPALHDLARFLSEPVFGDSDVYRPLAMLSHWLGQVIHSGPTTERVVSLALHLVGMTTVAAIARRLGASALAAWWGAAMVGVHPAATEAVAWISGRHDLLGTTLFLGGVWAVVARRPWAAGLLFGLTPFAKETFLLAPLAVAALLYALRGWYDPERPAPSTLPALGGAIVGVVTYAALRHALDLPLPVGAAGKVSLGAVGGVASRGLALFAGDTDALARYAPAPVVGGIALAIVLALVVARRHPKRALLLAAAILLAPAVPAAVDTGLVGDRYFYVALMLAGVLAGGGATRVLTWSPVFSVLLVLPLTLAPLTASRALDWTSDAALFGEALARNPDDPLAAFHVAHDLHTREGDCAAAVPLYRKAVAVERRARNNLLACLLDLEDYEAAMALSEEAAAGDPTNPKPAMNAARAHAFGGDRTGAARWAREATRRAPADPAAWILLGNVLGQAGAFAEALAAFERAAALDPASEEAARGIALAKARLAATP